MNIDFAFLTPAAALLGGSASLIAAIYTQRTQHRLHRVTAEITRRETVYADFVMSASHLLLNAHILDGITLNGDEQRLVGFVNRMRLFAPPEVIAAAEKVLRTIVDTMLKPGIELHQLAKNALSQDRGPDPLQAFSSICRADLDSLDRKVI